MAAVLAIISAMLFALAGATIITLGNRETQIPAEAVPDDRPRSDPAPA